MGAFDAATDQMALNLRVGALNLLSNCAEAQVGERLLIAYEPEDHGYFDKNLRSDIGQAARELGLHVSAFNVGFEPMAECLGETLLSSMQHADIVLFLARLGDQFRFSTLPDGPRILVCFAQSSEMLASSFGTAHYNAFCEAKRAVDLRMMQAREITITCPAGTEVKGHVPDDIAKATDTSLIRFPMSVFSPVLAREFSGRVALGDFLTGTGVHYYESYTVEFCEPVFAYLERGRIAGFEGSARDVAKANAHYDRVSKTFGLDRNAVHSWHAGIHPGCGFHLDIRGAYEKWGGAAFGNPRVLHFHTCGAEPPGEISWNLFDPTIMVDGMALWENGTFCLDRLDEGPGILAQYPCAAAAFAQPDREVGFQDVN